MKYLALQHTSKRTTRTVKRRPEEDSVRDKIAKRRAALQEGDKNAFRP